MVSGEHDTENRNNSYYIGGKFLIPHRTVSDNTKFGGGEEVRICELMEQRGIQRIQLADAMGVSPSCITKWVQGTALPSADKLPRLAAILQCSIDALYGPEPPEGGNGAAS